MKKVLLAGTALCMGAGMAMADVTVSGDGRMGIVSDADDNLKFDSRIRVKFGLSAELDSGLTAGGSIRADNASGGASGTGGSVYLSGPFGKLSMGDVDPGAKAAIGHVASVGYRNLGDPHEITYLRGGGDPTLQYELPKLGPVQVYASLGMATTDVMENGEKVPAGYSTAIKKVPAGETAANPLTVDGTGEVVDGTVTQEYKTMTEISADTLSIGAKADLAISDMGTAWIGGGFEASTNEAHDGQLVVGAGASISGFTGKVVVGMQGRDANAAGESQDVEQFAVSAGYSAGQIGVTVFYTDDKDYGGAEALGAGFSWDLGGDTSLSAGFTNWPAEEGAEDRQTADLGVTFAF